MYYRFLITIIVIAHLGCKPSQVECGTLNQEYVLTAEEIAKFNSYLTRLDTFITSPFGPDTLAVSYAWMINQKPIETSSIVVSEKCVEAYLFIEKSNGIKTILCKERNRAIAWEIILNPEKKTVNYVMDFTSFRMPIADLSNPSAPSYVGNHTVNQQVYTRVNKLTNPDDTLSYLYVNETEGILEFKEWTFGYGYKY